MSFASEHFSAVDEAIGPQTWMQQRLVVSGSALAKSTNYDPNDGQAKNDSLQSVQVAWTNDSPINQWVYGMVTKGGCRVALQCRSRGYISTRHGCLIGAGAISMIEVSQFGVGADLGAGGLLAIGGMFGINELQQYSTTATFMPHVAGWYAVAPGETFNARVETYFVSDSWENTAIEGGDGDTEAAVIAGELRLDLFAIPALTDPKARLTPSIVGGAGNVKYDVEVDLGLADTQTSVTLPTGMAAGDTLLAIVVNQLGFAVSMAPVESGWNFVGGVNDGFGSFGDVHLKVWARTITGSESGTYKFTNGLLAEETAILLAVRDADPFQPDVGNWVMSSSLSRYKLFKETHVAPSIARDGQMLLAVSFFQHNLFQAPITQTPPTGMTELVDLPATGTSVSVAVMTSPPNPTGDRTFTPSKIPTFSGHSICASILVPGKKVI